MENGRIERTFTLAPGVTPAIVARIPSGTMQIHGEERSDVAVTVTVHPADAIGRDLEIILEEQGERSTPKCAGRGGAARSSAGCAADSTARASRWRFAPPRAATSMRKRRARTSTWSGLEGRSGCGRRAATSAPTASPATVIIQTASGDVTTPRTQRQRPHPVRQRRCQPRAGEGEIGIQTASGDVYARSDQRDAGSVARRAAIVRSAPPRSIMPGEDGERRPQGLTTPLAPNGEYEFGTVSGDLLLQVPQETRMTVSMKTVSGDLSCALPATSTEGGKRNRTLAVNGGGVARPGQERQRRLHDPRGEQQPAPPARDRAARARRASGPAATVRPADAAADAANARCVARDTGGDAGGRLLRDPRRPPGGRARRTDDRRGDGKTRHPRRRSQSETPIIRRRNKNAPVP